MADGTKPIGALDGDAVDRILRRVASKAFDVAGDIEPELFTHTFNTIRRAIDSVFAPADFGGKDFAFGNELRHNAGAFAAFKTHRQQNDIHQQMWNDKGEVRSFAEFRKATAPILSGYNTTWLQTEYDTAIIRTQHAQVWQDAQRTKDIYPNGQWLPSTSVNKRGEHVMLYYKVWPLNSPFWSGNNPGSLWGCKCGFRVTSEAPTDGSVARKAEKSAPKPAAGLGGNVGATGNLFVLNTHPYATQGYKSFAKLRPMVTRYTDRVMLKYAQGLANTVKADIDKFRGLVILAQNLHTGSITFTRGCIKLIGKKNPDYRVLMQVTNPEKATKGWKYLGHKEVDNYPKGHKKAGERKHKEVARFLYYSVEIGGKMRYACVKQLISTKQEVLYCISDDMKDIIR